MRGFAFVILATLLALGWTVIYSQHANQDTSIHENFGESWSRQ